MTFDQIISELKKKIFRPVYFLMGEETFYIDEISEHISKNILAEHEKAFNQTILYGRDTDVNTIIGTARRFPMMANQQVVIIKEAQNLKNIEDFIHYVEKPLPSTILVICYKYKTIDKRKKLFKSLEKSCVVFESKKLYDNQIPDWIINYLRKQDVSIEPKAALLLSEYLGNDLPKIVNELRKLIISLPESDRRITPTNIEENIGISKEYNTFELNKALGQKDVLNANRIINYFAQNTSNYPITLTITSLYYYFSKLLAYIAIKDKSDERKLAATLQVHPFFLKEYQSASRNLGGAKIVQTISLLREYDMKSKGVGAVQIPPGELLKELTYKILH